MIPPPVRFDLPHSNDDLLIFDLSLTILPPEINSSLQVELILACVRVCFLPLYTLIAPFPQTSLSRTLHHDYHQLAHHLHQHHHHHHHYFQVYCVLHFARETKGIICYCCSFFSFSLLLLFSCFVSSLHFSSFPCVTLCSRYTLFSFSSSRRTHSRKSRA